MRVKFIVSFGKPIKKGMDLHRPRLAGACLSLLIAVVALAAQSPPYAPLPVRLEILHSWEKKTGLPPPPEIVAGIYEHDYLRGDFRNKIAITIDDALPNKYLATVLDILGRRGIRAVFFIIGRNFVDAEGRPTPRAKELLDRIVDEGHRIGSHSYWHRRMDQGEFRDNRKAIEAELDRNEVVVDRVLGYHCPILYFRPPNGAHSTPRYELDQALRARRQYLANWTITSFDWNMRYKSGNPDRLAPDRVVERTVKQAREEGGGVVLLHCFPETAALLDTLLDALSKAGNERGGFEFSTLDEIIRLKYAPESAAAAALAPPR